jgi:hypothetical protein
VNHGGIHPPDRGLPFGRGQVGIDKSRYAAHEWENEGLEGFAPSLPVEATGLGLGKFREVKLAKRLGF